MLFHFVKEYLNTLVYVERVEISPTESVCQCGTLMIQRIEQSLSLSLFRMVAAIRVGVIQVLIEFQYIVHVRRVGLEPTTDVL